MAPLTSTVADITHPILTRQIRSSGDGQEATKTETCSVRDSLAMVWLSEEFAWKR